jgi:DNA repair photolyase
VIVKEIEAKTVLVRSKLPDADYVVNPYTGCEFGCQYCYASFTGRFVNEPVANWGNYVYAKVNAVSLFEVELGRMRRAGRAPSLLLSSVTDPYQGAEKKYRLTRGILEALAREPYPGVVGILTKSPLVLRDVDVLQSLPGAEVGLTVTTTDDRLSRFLEVRAPLASRRLRTLAELHAAGIRTYAFVGPLLPHFRYDRNALDAVFAGLANAGVDSVFVEHINLRPYTTQRLREALDPEPANIQQVYRVASTAAHREALAAAIPELLQKHGLRLRLGKVLYHHEGGPGKSTLTPRATPARSRRSTA